MARVTAHRHPGRRARVVLLAVLALAAATGHAVGLGEMQLRSGLNERLDARVNLRGLDAGEVEELRVSLAPEAAFERAGLERSHLLTRLRFRVEASGPRAGSVHITSPDRIREPSLSFILQVTSRGRVLQRRYDALLSLR